jgi:predicted aspartyl protease
MATRSVSTRRSPNQRSTLHRLFPSQAWSQIAVVTVSLLPFLSCAKPAAAQAPTPIPFTLTHNFAITIRGEVAGAKNVSVLFDTGAVPSVISKRLAARIGVSGQAGSFSTLGSEADVAYAQVADIKLGSLQVPTLRVVILDLTGLESNLGTPIDAIVGLDFFGSRPLSIDYHRRVLEFSPVRPSPHFSDAEIVVREGSIYWVVTARLAGKNFRMLVDTGADGVALFRSSISAGLRAANKNDMLQTSLSMGDSDFKPQIVRIVDSPLASIGSFDGLVSPAALHMARLELDFHNKCIRWQQD